MDKERDRELEEAETWDFEKPEVKKPVKASRVVVSVAFQRDDFARVSEYAEQTGKRTSEFIREAAIEKTTGRGAWALMTGASGAGSWLSTTQMPPTTEVFALPLDRPEEITLLTY